MPHRLIRTDAGGQFPFDGLEGAADAVWSGHVQRDGLHPARTGLAQLRLSRLRQTSGEHVTSQRVQTPSGQVAEPSVASGDEDVPETGFFWIRHMEVPQENKSLSKDCQEWLQLCLPYL